jgi:4-amino-4-deoxy-L-arabinose transferase-like glycosyltransferase
MKRIKAGYSGLNIYYKLIPFLLFYLYRVISASSKINGLVGDENRYIEFANNLLHGFYSPPYPDISLWNGPGYPLFLAPFIFIGLPSIALKLINGFLLYGSLIICYKTIKIYSSERNAFIGAALLGLYIPIYIWLPFILTECFAWFLIGCVCYCFAKSFTQKNISWKLIILTGFSIAYLAMIKVVFGYVILSMLFVSSFLCLLPRFRSAAIKSALIFFVAFCFCLPWLAYTNHLTHKILFWTDSGSMPLYTMSTPYADELGDWDEIGRSKENATQCNFDSVYNANHKAFIDSIEKLKPMETYEAYKKAAINNIVSHPYKYITNWCANVGRLLFDYPYSYNTQGIEEEYWSLAPNMFLFVFILLTLPINIRYKKQLPEGFIFLLLFILIYLFGSTLVSTYSRMFCITVPFWFFYLAYFFSNIISIEVKRDEIPISATQDLLDVKGKGKR